MWPVNFFHHCEFLELTGNDAGLRAGPHVQRKVMAIWQTPGSSYVLKKMRSNDSGEEGNAKQKCDQPSSLWATHYFSKWF